MISFEALDAPLGAQATGFRPELVSHEDFAPTLAAALLRHGVLIFRGGATELTAAQLVELGRSFGELEILPEPDKRHPDHPEIFNLTNVRPDGEIVDFDEPQAVFLRGTQRWHTDSSFRKIPALCTMLYAVEVPAASGHTQFADMRQMFELLSPNEQSEMVDLSLVHSYEYSRGQNPGEMDPMSDQERAKYPPVEHPWVRTHSDGSKSLYMGGHASHISGQDQDASRARFAEIEARLSTDTVVYEHHWQANDLVVWDNRTTLHRLMGYDIANERRVMRRITVAGTDPVT